MIELQQRSQTETPLSVEVEYTPFINFAMQQNAVPLLRSLSVTNFSDKQASNLVVRVWSDPSVVAEKTLRLDAIAPGTNYAFSDLTLTLLREPLRRQSEREEGHLWIDVSADGITPTRKLLPLSVLAYNEWYGVSSLPEIIVAHVLPNDPAVERILVEASKLLLEKTQDGSLSGYQSGDPRRAYAQAAAIYFAAARQKIGYINPPASFEATGQKIRTPEHLLDRKLGTCMDTTVLLAACFEQAGLRSAVVLVEGHSFPGVWLVDKSFDDIVTGHASILMNRIRLGEFLVVESTGIAKEPPLSFKIAREQATTHLRTEVRFHFAVDVKAARKIGIRPLSLTEEVKGSASEDVCFDGETEPVCEDLIAPKTVADTGSKKSTCPPREQESAIDRLARWKTNLLDLSLRNRLLNFKDSKKSIPLLCSDIAGLEDALAADEVFRVRSKPGAWGAADPRDAALHQEQTGVDALADYLHEEMTQRRLHAAVTERDLSVRLTEIERATRLGLEEGGANTLFLALGFLVWTETATSDIERRAPILLIPMSIERKAVRDGFRIQRIDEESRINITLLQKLKEDFGITIDGLDPLPEDESGLDVAKILRTIRDAIKRQPRWKVEDDASLTILTFSRFLMWLDLEANAEELKKNGVVRHLIETSNELFDPDASFPDLENLDDRYSPSATFCPLHADSSQLRAVYAAAEGRTFVLQGPPGTGKSQTITNLIAHCLTVGKRVLFVAQKRAALDVVHKRLADVGLGPFCLELHSNKTTKESFRAQLREALGVAGTGTSEHWERETSRLAEQRKALNTYAHDLHQPRAFGKSAYWAISQMIGHDGEKKVSLDLEKGTNRTPEEYHHMRAAIRELMEVARITGEPSRHPLKAVGLKEWSYGIEEDVLHLIRATEDSVQLLQQIIALVMPEMGLPVENLSLADLEKVQVRCMALVADSDSLMRQVEDLLGTLPSADVGRVPEDPSSDVVASEDQWVEFQRRIEHWLEQARQRHTEILFRVQSLQRFQNGLNRNRYPAFQGIRWETFGWNVQSISDLQNLIDQLMDLLKRWATELQRQMDTYKNRLELITERIFLPNGVLTTKDWVGLRDRLLDAIRRGKARDEMRKGLLAEYSPQFLELDVGQLLDSWHNKDSQWLLKRWWNSRAVRKEIGRVCLRKPGKADDLKMEKDLECAYQVLQESHRLASEDGDAAQFFHTKWAAGEAEWAGLEEAVAWADQFRRIIDAIPERDHTVPSMVEDVSRQINEAGKRIIGDKGKIGGAFVEFLKTFEAFREAQHRLEGTLCLSLPWGDESVPGSFDNVDAVLRNFTSNLSRLREWTHYQSARTAVVHLHLSGVVNDLEQNNVGISEVESLFEHSFADWWVRTVLKSIPSLVGFIGERHALKIREFREHDAKIADLTRKETFARIASGMPRVASAGQRPPASSEAGLLQRFSQGGRKTIRRIFKECPNALARYKPCLLMSPLSVAQFIGADFPKFDMVVFDEASQMPTYDAIGAIARGNQLVVVGDSRQLPPTSFFERQKGNEEYSEDDMPEELESILEEAEAAGIKPLRLDWHYRSRHESLIAFSNRQYYENRLHTFPAALSEHPRLGVRWCEVPDGVYDHGKSRTNLKEAEAVVAEIIRRLLDPQEQSNSLGVVTFSQAQQSLVEDLLDAARGEYPEIEPHFTTVSEPVFVKNLETVQGDERDVILFSICYGPDVSGVIRMNFGPLNNKGGERRLNVAVTRARKQLLVFSRLRPEQIDLSRTQATGVHDLRTFLDYAKRGQVAFAEEVARTRGEVESFFEQAVLDELTARGWQVDPQVGCSGYRIDLAVRDPEFPGRYILGVECDGANYHSAKSARDRDRIRQAVLEGLGWQLHRVWSTDWWLQRPKEIAKIEEALELAKQKFRAADDLDLSPPANIPPAYVPIENAIQQEMNQSFAREAAVVEQKPLNPFPCVVEFLGQSIYRRYETPQTFSGELHDPTNAHNVCDLVRLIVNTEAPLLFDILCSEVASAWGLQRAGSRIRELVRIAVKHNGLPVRRSGKREFVWTKELSEKPYEGFRVPGERDSKTRTAEEICPEEIANTAAQVLALHISMGQDDLTRETASVFGITRLGNKVRSSFEEGIELMKKNGGCRIEGESLVTL
jgi:very-short-patch-repair endonuclease